MATSLCLPTAHPGSLSDINADIIPLTPIREKSLLSHLTCIDEAQNLFDDPDPAFVKSLSNALVPANIEYIEMKSMSPNTLSSRKTNTKNLKFIENHQDIFIDPVPELPNPTAGVNSDSSGTERQKHCSDTRGNLEQQLFYSHDITLPQPVRNRLKWGKNDLPTTFPKETSSLLPNVYAGITTNPPQVKKFNTEPFIVLSQLSLKDVSIAQKSVSEFLLGQKRSAPQNDSHVLLDSQNESSSGKGILQNTSPTLLSNHRGQSSNEETFSNSLHMLSDNRKTDGSKEATSPKSNMLLESERQNSPKKILNPELPKEILNSRHVSYLTKTSSSESLTPSNKPNKILLKEKSSPKSTHKLLDKKHQNFSRNARINRKYKPCKRHRMRSNSTSTLSHSSLDDATFLSLSPSFSSQVSDSHSVPVGSPFQSINIPEEFDAKDVIGSQNKNKEIESTFTQTHIPISEMKKIPVSQTNPTVVLQKLNQEEVILAQKNVQLFLERNIKNISSQMHTHDENGKRPYKTLSDDTESNKKLSLHKNHCTKYVSNLNNFIEITNSNLSTEGSYKNDILPHKNLSIKRYEERKCRRNSSHKACNKRLNLKKENEGDFHRYISELVKYRRQSLKKNLMSSDKSNTNGSTNRKRKRCHSSFRASSNKISMSYGESDLSYGSDNELIKNIELHGSCELSFESINTEGKSPEIGISHVCSQPIFTTLSNIEHKETDSNCEVFPPESGTKSTHREKRIENDYMNKRKNIESVKDKNSMNFYCYEKFYRTVETILDRIKDINISAEKEEDRELLIPLSQLEKLSNEAAKMKKLSAMNKFPSRRIDLLLKILEMNIDDGTNMIAEQMTNDTDGYKDIFNVKSTMKRVIRSASASLIALNIITSKIKKLFFEDVVEKIVLFIKNQLYYTIFPEFDDSYRLESIVTDQSVSNKRQKTHQKQSIKKKSYLQLYYKLLEIFDLLGELLEQQTLVDTLILQISTLGIDILFVEGINELQPKAVHLVTIIFSRYDKLRQLILKEILASVVRLPSKKKVLRSYRLTSGQNIQIFTALILQLMHSVIRLPKSNLELMSSFSPDAEKNETSLNTERLYEDKDSVIIRSYQESVTTAFRFLSAFMQKSFTKQDETDYRILFENFVQDLLNTLNKPEWPSSELLLSILGKILLRNLREKSIEISLKVASIEFFGLIAAQLQKSNVGCQDHKNVLTGIIDILINEEGRNMDMKINETQILQIALLQYLDLHVENDFACEFARRFYIALWYKDADDEKERQDILPNDSHNHLNPQKKKKKKPRSNVGTQLLNSKNRDEEQRKEKDNEKCKIEKLENGFLYSLSAVDKKLFLLKAIEKQDRSKSNIKMKKHINFETAQVISEYLASTRPFQKNFDLYLSEILRVLSETAVSLRAKAIKCLTIVVENDPNILSRLDVQKSVQGRLLDTSVSVREATVDLLSKFILAQPEFINQYYEILGERMLDTGVGVRKKVIKMFTSICLKHPDFSKTPEICVKIMKRINDEDSIKKLVTDFFQSIWFSSLPEGNDSQIFNKLEIIIHVIKSSAATGLETFKQLLKNFLGKKEDDNYKSRLKLCKIMVDCLVKNLMKFDEAYQAVNTDMSSDFIVCLKVLRLFCEICPSLILPHAIEIESYLSIKCNKQSDIEKIRNVALILEIVLPLMEHPSATFLAQIEEHILDLILHHPLRVLPSCLKCISTIVNKVTHNYKLVKQCFQNCFNTILKIRKEYQNIPENKNLISEKPKLLRSIYTVGLFCCYFDFESLCVDFREKGKYFLKERVLESLMFFNHHSDLNIRKKALEALGFLLIKHPDLMLRSIVKSLYYQHLLSETASSAFKCQVLKNIANFLIEEVTIMTQIESNWKDISKTESLKEMGDVQGGMASTIVQVYLEQILKCALHAETVVRLSALSVIQIIVCQGLVDPTKSVPFLVCLGADDDPDIWTKASDLLLEIGKKDPVFIQMKAATSVRMSFEFQKKIQNPNVILRGFRNKERPVSRNGSLYSAIRAKRQNRRALLLSLLKLFDEEKFFEIKAPTSLRELLYIADNLAYFPYMVHDEPLFLMHHLDLKVSVLLSNSLQTFQESLLNQQSSENFENFPIGKDVSSHDNKEKAFEFIKCRLPENNTILQKCIIACQACELLLYVKNTLKKMYDLTDKKIQEYSPNELTKIYERLVTRKEFTHFDPETVLTFIKSDEFENQSSDKQKDELVSQYLHFKQLMTAIELADDNDEDDNPNKALLSTPINSFVSSTTKLSVNEITFENNNLELRLPTKTVHHEVKFEKTSEN